VSAQKPAAHRDSKSPDPNVELATIAEALTKGLFELGAGLAPFVRVACTFVGAGLLVVARAAWTHRAVLFSVSHRVAFWSALLLLFVVGRERLSGFASDPIMNRGVLCFAVGLGLCVFVLVFAPERRMRIAALALGFAHGALAILCMQA
jgi:Na+-translocating ferredoxin:NAD+ oxidoreductase RnfA subunit